MLIDMKFRILLLALFALGIIGCAEAQQSKNDSIVGIADTFIGKKYHKTGIGPKKYNNTAFIKSVYAQMGIDVSDYLKGVGHHPTIAEVKKGDLVYLPDTKEYAIIRNVGEKTEIEIIIATKPKILVRRLTADEIQKINTYRIIPDPIIDEPIIEYEKEEIIECEADETTPLQPEIVELATPLPDTITIAMVGDIMMGTTYPDIELPANNGKNLFDDVKQILRDADLALGNLEGAMCEGGTCTKRVAAGRSYAFRMPTSYATNLSDAGFDFLSIANNHSNDFGPDGIRSTAKCLDEQGIKYAGAKALACKSAIIERDGLRYGICAFGHNTHTYQHLDIAEAAATVKSLRDSCDILIVSFHGGAEGSKQAHLPKTREIFLGEDRGALREFAHKCIDVGADVVFGHGPHVTRAIEAYKGKFIAYSLGNFCTPYGINLAGISGYAPVVTIRIDRKGDLIDGRIYSFIQQKGLGPKLDKLNKVAQEMKSLTLADFDKQSLNIENDGFFTTLK